jgi:hypothetical protein
VELLDEDAAGVRLAGAALREDRDRLAGDVDRQREPRRDPEAIHAASLPSAFR